MPLCSFSSLRPCWAVVVTLLPPSRVSRGLGTWAHIATEPDKPQPCRPLSNGGSDRLKGRVGNGCGPKLLHSWPEEKGLAQGCCQVTEGWHGAMHSAKGLCLRCRAGTLVGSCLAPQHKHNGSPWLDAAFLASLTEAPGFNKGDRQAARKGDTFLP